MNEAEKQEHVTESTEELEGRLTEEQLRAVVGGFREVGNGAFLIEPIGEEVGVVKRGG